MKYRNLVAQFRERPFFESKEVLSLFDEPKNQVQKSLSVWTGQGKLLQLRRGCYLFPEEVRTKAPSDYYLSNYLYRPSYVSLQTALAYYGLIPEAIGRIQAVSPRHGTTWETPAGTFSYQKIKEERFWGYTVHSSGRPEFSEAQSQFYIARPEKALIDLFYFQKGEWTEERIREMRFQNIDRIDRDRLDEDAKRFGSPNVQNGVDRFLQIHREDVPS